MPASSAAWIVATLSSSSVAPYMPDISMQPRPNALTVGPVVPSCRVCMPRISPLAPPGTRTGPSGDRRSLDEHGIGGQSGGMGRAGLADLLRSRRLRLAPADVGIPPGTRRRTPGLRRDEVAALAAISTDYYTRLEQQRGPNPSVAVLGALARAVRMTDDERDHLFFLAGQQPPMRHVETTHVSPGLLHLLDRLADTPAFVVNDLEHTVFQNAMSVAVMGDQQRYTGRERSFTWRWFTDAATRVRFPESDWPTHSRTHVANLRATHGRRGADADVASLVTDLLAASPEFAGLWAEHE